MLSVLLKYSNCLSSTIFERGEGLGTGRHEVGTLNRVGGIEERVEPPDILTKSFSGGNLLIHSCLSI